MRQTPSKNRSNVLSATALTSVWLWALANTTLAMAAEKAWEGLEEIVVSAERREANIQKVPISMVAMQEEFLSKAKIEDTMDLASAIPNLSVTENFQAQIYIRGIGSDLQGVGSDPSVAVYIDGVYVPRPNAALQSFFDVDRVEILRGPQGTLYGRNATGGAINVITKKPSKELTANMEGQYGNYDAFQLRGTVSGPLSGDTVSARATIIRGRHDGYIKELSGGEDHMTQDLWAGRAGLTLTNNENLEFTITADFTRDHSNMPATVLLDPEVSIPVMLGGQVSDDHYEVYNDMFGPSKRDQWGIVGDLKWSMAQMTLVSISAYRETDTLRSYDGDSTDFPFVGEDRSFEKSKTYSQELRLSSDNDGPFIWMIGAYYMHEDANGQYNLPFPIIASTIQLPAQNKTDAYAVYTQNSYNLTESFRLTAGLRYSYEKKDHLSDTVINGVSLLPNPGKDSWKAWTPKFGIEYFPAEDVMVYASVTRGFKSGGFNSTGFQLGYDPEYIWSYEAGIKSTFADGRVQLNLAGFIYDYKDLQVSVIDGQTTATVVDNATSAKIKGAEIGIVAAPIENLRLDANFGILDTEYKDLITYDQNLPGFPQVNLAGNSLPNAPKFSMQISGEYSHEIGNSGSLSLRAEWLRRSHVYFSQYNYDVEEQDAYDLVNGSLTFTSADDGWKVSIYGKNLFNKEYVNAAVRIGLYGGATVAYMGAPRTYGISLGYQY